MNSETFVELLENKKNLIDDVLPQKVEMLDAHSSLKEAMLYSILAGGKGYGRHCC